MLARGLFAIAGPSAAAACAARGAQRVAQPALGRAFDTVRLPRAFSSSQRLGETGEGEGAASTSTPSAPAQDAPPSYSPRASAASAWAQIQESIQNERNFRQSNAPKRKRPASPFLSESDYAPRSPRPGTGRVYGAPGQDEGALEDDFEEFWQNRRIHGHNPYSEHSKLSRSAAGPSSGRVVPMESRNISLPKAMQMLNNTMKRNDVRFELSRTSRHEKPNQMRRRLRSERHRRRFASMVREKVKLVRASIMDCCCWQFGIQRILTIPRLHPRLQVNKLKLQNA